MKGFCGLMTTALDFFKGWVAVVLLAFSVTPVVTGLDSVLATGIALVSSSTMSFRHGAVELGIVSLRRMPCDMATLSCMGRLDIEMSEMSLKSWLSKGMDTLGVVWIACAWHSNWG